MSARALSLPHRSSWLRHSLASFEAAQQAGLVQLRAGALQQLRTRFDATGASGVAQVDTGTPLVPAAVEALSQAAA